MSGPSLFGRFKPGGSLLRTSKTVEAQVESFLSTVVQSGQIFSKAFAAYLAEGASAHFQTLADEIRELERQGDDLRREIETELYTRTLIPDLRSDVLSLVENIDKLTNLYKANLFRLSIQNPAIPKIFHDDYRELTRLAVSCAEAVIDTTRSFFTDHHAVRAGAKHVAELETQADEVSTPLQRRIFESDLELAHKVQLRYFVEKLDEVANQAEDVADQLAISAIKRRI